MDNTKTTLPAACFADGDRVPYWHGLKIQKCTTGWLLTLTSPSGGMHGQYAFGAKKDALEYITKAFGVHTDD